MAAFLASDDASFVTGSHYVLDNALTAPKSYDPDPRGQDRDRHRRRQGHRPGDRRRARQRGRDGGARRHRRRRRRRGGGRASTAPQGVACDVRDEAQVAALVATPSTSTATSTSWSPTRASRRSTRSSRCRWRSGVRCSTSTSTACSCAPSTPAAAMAGNGGGSIINIASIKAFGGSPATGPLRRRQGRRRVADQDRRDRAARPRRARQRDLPGLGRRPTWSPTARSELESVLGVDFERGDRPHPGAARRARGDRRARACSWRPTARASRAGSTYIVDGGATASLVP